MQGKWAYAHPSLLAVNLSIWYEGLSRSSKKPKPFSRPANRLAGVLEEMFNVFSSPNEHHNDYG
jgi:hypothetical protein